jgi:large subunit ribosomal protein L3
MAGHYGAERVTTNNLEIVAVRADDNLLLIRGAVPGARNGTVIVRRLRRRQAGGTDAEAGS